MARKTTGNLTPEQNAALLKFARNFRAAAAGATERAAELAKARKTVDRAQAIRDGLIPPPWADKRKSKAKAKAKAKNTKLGWQERLIIPLLRDRWPPDGIAPANFDKPDAVQDIGDAFQKQHKVLVSRNTILRAIARNNQRHRRR